MNTERVNESVRHSYWGGDGVLFVFMLTFYRLFYRIVFIKLMK